MNEKICRFCLQTVGENCQEIELTLENIFKINLDISKDAVMCIECRNNLQVFFKLKSACVDVRERTLSLTDMKNNVNLDPVKTVNTNLKLFTEPKDDIRCSFCTKSTGKEGLTSLHESTEDMFLVDMLEKYIPELNLRIIGGLLTCETCLDRIQGFSRFLTKYLNVEEKISKYIEIEGTDDKGQIELKNVQQFTFKSTIKSEAESCHEKELRPTYDCVQEEFPLKAEGEISDEIEVNNLKSLIKTEDVDIKSEQSDCDRYQEPSAKIKLDNDDMNSLNITVYNCDKCTYETTHRPHFNRHKRLHKSSSEIKRFKCELCEFKAKHRYIINKHLLTHKSASEVTMFKCSMCDYESKYKYYLKTHMLVHKNPAEITMFKCQMCTYEAKYEANLKRHILIHKKLTKVTMYKCDTCTYETKHRGHFNQHKLLHKRRTEIEMFKCELCEFEAKHKYSINQHFLTHKSPSEVTMFKCEMCEYETRRKDSLRRHMLIHKSPSEVIMYKCGTCTFETKYKKCLTQHELIHKSPSEIPKFKCAICEYETKRKDTLKTHMLMHKRPSQVKV